MNNIPILETDRLILRPFELSDASRLQALSNDEDIYRFTQIPSSYDKEDILEWISSAEKLFRDRIEVYWGIVVKESGDLIGAVSLSDIFELHQAELGFWIGKDFRGNGYASEAAKCVVEFAFGEPLKLIRVHAYHLSRNETASRVLKKIGMSNEGHCPKHFMKNGIAEDIDLWGILK